MARREGLTRLAAIIRTFGAALFLLCVVIGGLITQDISSTSEAFMVGGVSIAAGFTIYCAARGVAWVIDGFASDA